MNFLEVSRHTVKKSKPKKTKTIKDKPYWSVNDICEYTKSLLNKDTTFNDIYIKCLVKKVSVYPYCVYVDVMDANVKSKKVTMSVSIQTKYYKKEIKNNDVVFFRGRIDIDASRSCIKLYANEYDFDANQESNYDFIMNNLKKNKILDIPKKSIPENIKNIAIISSENASGLKDCINVLQNGICCNIYFYHSPVQGPQTKKGITANLELLNKRDDIDIVLIIRGGGAKTDLEWFDDYDIATAVKTSMHPVICGIGHETDHTILDIVADISCTTPTQVGHFILAKLMERKEKIQRLIDYYNNAFNQLCEKLKLCDTYITTGNNIIFTNLKHQMSNIIGAYNVKLNEIDNSMTSIRELTMRGFSKYESYIHKTEILDKIYEQKNMEIHETLRKAQELLNKHETIKIISKKNKNITTKKEFSKMLKNKKGFHIKFLDGTLSHKKLKELCK